MRKKMYSTTHCYPWHQVNVIGDLHVQDACSLGKQPPLPIDMRLGVFHSQHKHIWEKKKSLSPAGNGTTFHKLHRPQADRYKDYVILTPSLYVPWLISIFGYDKAELVLLLVGFHVQIKLQLFITQSALQQVQCLFHIKSSTQCDPVLSPSSSTFQFP